MSEPSFEKTWVMPLLLNGFSLFGLLTALLGTGYWYWLAWGTLLFPLLIIVTKIIKRPSK